MAKNDFQYGGWYSYTLQYGTIMTLISPGDCILQCGVWLWNRDSEFTMWQEPAKWHVALERHAIEFARWQNPAMWHVTLESWHWIRQVAAPCNVAGSSGMTCHWIRANVRHIGILHSGCDLDQITAVDMSFCTSFRNFIQIGPPSAEKMTSCRFSRWRISAILDFRDPIKKPNYITSYRSLIDTVALKCLVFQKIAFLHIGVNIQDGGSPPSWTLEVQ